MPKKTNQSEEFKKWFIKYRLQNGVEECYPLSALEKNDLSVRLPKICEEKGGLDFFEFNTTTHRILMQSAQLIFFQFLFEPQYNDDSPNTNEEEEDPYAVKIYFTNNPNPMIFNVEVDQPDLADEGNKGEMNNFLFYALNTYEEEQLLHFTDEDGETAFFKASRIALVEIPLEVLQAEELLYDS
ncbi:MAG: hypothetical protein K2W92_06650 [Alphaproteobacteria bacterium]|nr:hypothetical protein [Alphaproteobacteria bacterium]